MSNTRGLVHQFDNHAAQMTGVALPGAAQEAPKKSKLVSLGVIVAASGLEPTGRGVIDIVRDSGGTADCTRVALPLGGLCFDLGASWCYFLAIGA